MLSNRANERGRAITKRAIGAACLRLLQRKMIAPAALLGLAGLSVALSPAVALAGVERLGPGAWREAAGGEASPSFSRWAIELDIDDAAIRTAQRGGPLSVNATVRDAGFGGLLGGFEHTGRETRTARASVEIRPAPDERGKAGAPVVLPATHDTDDADRFEASAAGRIISTLNSDRVQVRAAAYSPLPRIAPSNTPRLGGTTTRPTNAGRPGWWRGVSEWRVVDLEPTPAMERLWVRITGADGLPRGLYELDPRREGQRVPAAAGDVVTIEVDASVRLWGMEVELIDRDAATPEQAVEVDAVFEEVERGTADRVAWRSYRICGHEGSEVGVGVRAIAQRRAGGTPDANSARGLVSEISSPFSLLIAQAADWVETAQSAATVSPDAQTENAAETGSESVAVRDHAAGETSPVGEASPAGEPVPTRVSEVSPSNGSTNDQPATPSARPQAGGEPMPGPRESQSAQRERGNATNNQNTPNEQPAPGPVSRPTGEPQLGGDPEPGSSGQAARRTPEAEPAAEPESTPPARRVGGGDEPEMVQSVALLRPRGVNARITLDPADADRLVIVFGLDAVSPEDRAIALAYRRVLIGEARKAERDDRGDGADERTPNP